MNCQLFRGRPRAQGVQLWPSLHTQLPASTAEGSRCEVVKAWLEGVLQQPQAAPADALRRRRQGRHEECF